MSERTADAGCETGWRARAQPSERGLTPGLQGCSVRIRCRVVPGGVISPIVGVGCVDPALRIVRIVEHDGFAAGCAARATVPAGRRDFSRLHRISRDHFDLVAIRKLLDERTPSG